MLESIPDFGALFERKSPEDVQRMLDEYLADDDSAEDMSTETNRYGNTTSQTSANSVESAFNELLG